MARGALVVSAGLVVSGVLVVAVVVVWPGGDALGLGAGVGVGFLAANAAPGVQRARAAMHAVMMDNLFFIVEWIVLAGGAGKSNDGSRRGT